MEPENFPLEKEKTSSKLPNLNHHFQVQAVNLRGVHLPKYQSSHGNPLLTEA